MSQPRLALVRVLLFLAITGAGYSAAYAKGNCHGRLVNPITDICWDCLFPITISGVKITSGDHDTPAPKLPAPPIPLCVCARNGVGAPVPGMPIGFWEPSRLVDVTRSPMCMVGLGGTQIGGGKIHGIKEDGEGAIFHVHWYIYPVIYWLELLLDFMCLEMSTVDIAYMTEYDPLWGDDVKATILNPEAILFANPVATLACSADCVAASAGLPLDPMFWCAGCQGSIYPLSGTISYHNGGVEAAQLTVSKFMAKMHRELMLWGYYGSAGMCGKYPMPIIKKSQYRLQMTYPIPETKSCKRIGQTSILWQGGREYPIFGEDFGFLVWRKRDCCLL